MINPIGGPARAASVYGRQQYYAERAAELKTPKTVQVTAIDRVSFTPAATSRAAAIGAYVPATPGALPSRHDIAVTARQIYYDNPRKKGISTAESAPAISPVSSGRSFTTAFVAGIYADDQAAGEQQGRGDQGSGQKRPLADQEEGAPQEIPETTPF